MSAVSSSGSEPFVLARRGLPLAGGARPSSPARWFASFAFARSRVSAGPDVPAMPGAAPPGETEQDLEETRLAAGGPWPEVETAAGIRNAAADGARAPMRPQGTGAREEPARVDFETRAGVAAPFPKRDAPQEDILARRAGGETAARPAEEAWNERTGAKSASVRALLGTGQPVEARGTGRSRQIIAPPALDPVQAEPSSAVQLPAGAAGTKGDLRAGARPSMGTPPAIGLDDTASKSPPFFLPVPEAGAFRTATTPNAARHPARPATASGNRPPLQKSAVQVAAPAQGSAPLTPAVPGEAGAPARFATPMGTPHAAPRSDPNAAASPAEIAQLVERSLAANAGGRVTHRIGTVQVVVQSIAPATRGAPDAPRVPGPSHAPTAREPVRRGFRNPWASYTRRSD